MWLIADGMCFKCKIHIVFQRKRKKRKKREREREKKRKKGRTEGRERRKALSNFFEVLIKC